MTVNIIFMFMVAAAIFFLVISFGVPVFSERASAKRQLRRRLSKFAGESNESVSRLLRQSKIETLTPLEARFETMPTFEKMRVLLEQSGSNSNVMRLLFQVTMMSLLGFSLTYLVFSSIIFAILGGAGFAYLPLTLISRKRLKRINKFEERLPEAIDIMRRALQTGYPLVDALRVVAEETDGPCATEFGLTYVDINYGAGIESAFNALLTRMPSVTLMTLTTAIIINKETGGNLSDVLKKIGVVVRERFQFQRTVKSLTSEGRTSTWILVMTPFALFVFLNIVSPDYIGALINDPAGQRWISYSFVLMMLGIFWMNRMLRLDV